MPVKKAHLRPATPASRPLLKPKPPANLWDALEAIAGKPEPLVTGGFTILQYAERYEVTPNMARACIDRLLKAKKLKRIGKRRKEGGGAMLHVYDLA